MPPIHLLIDKLPLTRELPVRMYKDKGNPLRHLHDRRRHDRRMRDMLHRGVHERRRLGDRRGIVVREISLGEWMQYRVAMPEEDGSSPKGFGRKVQKPLPLSTRSSRFVRIAHFERTLQDRRGADLGPPPGRRERRQPDDRRALVVNEISYLEFLDSTRTGK